MRPDPSDSEHSVLDDLNAAKAKLDAARITNVTQHVDLMGQRPPPEGEEMEVPEGDEKRTPEEVQ